MVAFSNTVMPAALPGDYGVPATPSALPPGSPLSPKILLVEDDDADASLLCMALERADVQTDRLQRVRFLTEATERLDDEPYDIVVADLGLPDARGPEVAASLARHRSRTPVVVLSGREDDAIAEQVRTHGAHDYLVKGLAEPIVIRRTLEKAIAQRSLKSSR